MMTQTLSVSLPYDVVYCSGTVNGIDRTWTNTTDNTWETVVDRVVDETYVVVLTLVNSIGTVSTETFTLYYGAINLITDRTAADVTRWKKLKEKGWQNLTEEEQAEWLSSLKGAYNYTDMNRVESAVKYLADRLTEDGYIFHPEVKTTWAVTDKPQQKDIDRYFYNVEVLRSLLAMYSTTPITPTTAKKFDYQKANDLEQILVDLNDLANRMEQTWLYSNDIFCGEV